MRYVIPLLMTFVLYTITYILNKRKYAINILVLTERCTLVEEINYKLSEQINLATKKQLEMDTWPYVYCPWILDVATRIWRGRVSYSKFLQLHHSTHQESYCAFKHNISSPQIKIFLRWTKLILCFQDLVIYTENITDSSIKKMPLKARLMYLLQPRIQIRPKKVLPKEVVC